MSSKPFGKMLYLGVFLGVLVATPVRAVADSPERKIGILFSSYGDVDSPQEVRDLVVRTITDTDIIPVPSWVGSIVGAIGWPLVKDGILEEYAAIGNATGFRVTAQRQAELVAELLRAEGLNVTAYTGFTKTFPYIWETLAQMQQDGVEQIVLFYQGAQYSQVSAYIVHRETRKYLSEHPEWNVDVVAVRSFSDDPRFQSLVVDNIRSSIEEGFPGASEEEVCIFLPMHGNVMHWIERGDPSYDQMLRAVESVTQAFPNSFVSYGFQNHDEIPFTAWTEPNTDAALDVVAQQSCPYVVINGQISYTIDSLETLFDHQIGEVEYLQEKTEESGGHKEVVVSPMFNDDPVFAEYLKKLVLEALQGRGDLESLRTFTTHEG